MLHSSAGACHFVTCRRLLGNINGYPEKERQNIFGSSVPFQMNKYTKSFLYFNQNDKRSNCSTG